MSVPTVRVLQGDIPPTNLDHVKQIIGEAVKGVYEEGEVAHVPGETGKEQSCAQLIKEGLDAFDGRGGVWHVVVGSHFGAYFSHQSAMFFYGKVAYGRCELFVLCYKP